MDDPSARRLIARPWAMLTTARARLPDAARQILRLSLLLVTFVAFTTLVERLTHLPTAAYEQTSPSIELVKRVGWLATFVLISATAVLAHLGRLLAPWDALQLGRELRLFVVLLGVGIAWPLVTAGHNFYFDQGYLADKVLLVALVPLTWWRPVFVFPLTVVAYLLLWQLGEPSLGGSIFAHKLQVLRP